MWLNVVDCGMIYISPSSEKGRRFACGGTNEAEQMAIVAEYLAERLAECGAECTIAKSERSYIQRTGDAEKCGAQLYIGLQATVFGAQEGTAAYYHDCSGFSIELAYRLHKNIGALTPSKDKTGVANGNYRKQTEIVYSWEHKIPAVVLGVEDRYSKQGTQWIVDNAKTLGYAIADTIPENYVGF